MPTVNGYEIERGANLNGANLCKADLCGANLRCANLSCANPRVCAGEPWVRTRVLEVVEADATRS